MFGKDSDQSEKVTDGEARKNKKVIETALSQSFEKTQPTHEFRQTLLKSGLEVSAVHQSEPQPAKISADNSLRSDAADSAKSRNEFLEAGLIQNSIEPPEKTAKGLSRFGRWQHLTAVTGILAIIVLQSAFQFFFIQEEDVRTAENIVNKDLPTAPVLEKSVNEEKDSEIAVPKIKEETVIEIKTEYKKSSAEMATRPDKVAAKARRELPVNNSPRTALRKKVLRESNAERLRRVEKILTGI